MALWFKLKSMSPKDLLSLAVDGACERELSASWVDCESLRISLHDGVPNLMTHRLTIVILGGNCKEGVIIILSEDFKTLFYKR